MTRVAALDCGTNSLRLLVADIDGHMLTDVVRRMEVVRLGAGVDRTGQLAPEALARTFGVLDDYAAELRALDVEAVRMVATSATRDASNREEFVAGVRQRLGIDPEVVTGDEEATLSFIGATRELQGDSELTTPYLVVDIGGGSTEFVLGDASGPMAARSVDVGCVRMTERHLVDDPATEEQIGAARADVVAAIDVARSVVPVEKAQTLIGLAGSVTTVVALALGLTEYDAQRIHHSRVSAGDVRRITTELLAATRAERTELPVMHPGRVDVIGGGALVLDTIMAEGGFADVVASEHDILDGIAFSLVSE
ncbi:MAG TPA: Ppx/GppA phosphatase family protein [Mycobacteriales bacterium]|jgi:exopolyphosphatase/guanosine-5'-triphosphate,3'-diphosphate pyrophosphatase|nr:Ppx/GppA phosphatase family protein [Mycobacteriales bacterium]